MPFCTPSGRQIVWEFAEAIAEVERKWLDWAKGVGERT